MNQLEEAVLLATIDEGGNNPVQKFSTIHIAAACGVSEFLIYEHFVSRQKLLVEADDYVAQHFRAQVLALTEKHLPYPELFSALLDYQLAHPSWNGFSLNYGHFFPRYMVSTKLKKSISTNLSSRLGDVYSRPISSTLMILAPIKSSVSF